MRDPGRLAIPAVATFMLLVWALSAPAQDAVPSAARVTIAAAYTEDLVEEVRFIGRGEAAARSDLIARVTGFVREVAVADGAAVEAGDTVFRIESDRYEAARAAAAAELAGATADLELARIELDRKTALVAREAAPQSELDLARAAVAAAEAGVAAARAALRQTELDLGYTVITAPFDGRLGRIGVSPGAYVGPTTEPLATIVQQSPIYVAFSLSEGQLVDLLQQVQTDIAGLTGRGAAPLVSLELPNGTVLEERGRIAFLDNRVDPETGTLTLRAEFDNARGLILDGAFVNVRIQAARPVPRLLVPQAAVQRDQRGDFVLVVDDTGHVEQRHITLGRQAGTAVVVEEGLREGESVILEGLQRVRPGVPVEAVLDGRRPAER
ncbi:efflux RND transporter periplasmic adaptor subunit [Rhodovulum sp. 12E13]|nr:efflux RND transporter periplasmic adaptor subunit [Rhodovulum sp. 12E13]